MGHICLCRRAPVYDAAVTMRRQRVACVRCGVACVVCWSLAVVVWLLLLLGGGQLSSVDWKQLDSCPVCYGQTACHMLHATNRRAVRLAPLSQHRWLRPANVKNIFYGSYGDRPVVLKKLAHSAELRAFDERVCNGSARCAPRRAVYAHFLHGLFPALNARSIDSTDAFVGVAAGLRTFDREHLTCASPRFLKFLHDAVDDTSLNKLYHFTTMLLINPEPLFLQAFPQTGGWPFARFYGSCGRLVIEQYIGRTLTTYYSATYRLRVELALQLLEICDMLTVGYRDFSLYLTDVSPDNLAVDADGRLFVIDVEDVLVVDRRQVEQEGRAGYNETHISPVLCADCMGYEPDQVCRHTRSDHNYFAVCRGLLSADAFSRQLPGGLLHDPPSWVLDALPELPLALRQCADPGDGGDTALSRIETADRLRHVLNLVLAEQSPS